MIFYSIPENAYEEALQLFSSEYDGTYHIGKFGNEDFCEIRYKEGKIIFDRYLYYQVVAGRTFDHEFTRVRYEFKGDLNFNFEIHEQGIVDQIAKFIGFQDIRIGNSIFDRKFMIQATDEHKMRVIFSDDTIQNSLLQLKDVNLYLLKERGIFHEPVCEEMVMLYFLSEKKIRHKDQWIELYTLFQLLINQLNSLV